MIFVLYLEGKIVQYFKVITVIRPTKMFTPQIINFIFHN